MHKHRFAVLGLILTGVAGLYSASVAAVSLRVSPTTIELQSNQNSQTLSVFNESSEPATLQARVFKWTQENGRDVLVPTTEVVVSPPVTNLAATSSYNYRIVRLDKMPIKDEKSYRLILDEIPKPLDSRKMSQGLTVLMRISLPVFISNPESQFKLAWKIEQRAEKSALIIMNQGGLRSLITEVKLIDATTKKEYPLQIGTVNGYVLAGSERSYAIGHDFVFDPTHQYHLQLNVNGKDTQL
ncbi:molecular chaperone [Acinetobacter sp. B10A]|uniref:fimbrial biogenesis chaperone n=1 Tax=Acinetobacter baretiae TaxID=2605383 RepID=UPI001B3C75F2|nr:fimbria/pilus periplasmic chaperone [Acinetobacter baretiae]MBF7686143.1 molecular chaperone [Acinetobacter baretiae]